MTSIKRLQARAGTHRLAGFSEQGSQKTFWAYALCEQLSLVWMAAIVDLLMDPPSSPEPQSLA